MKNEENGAPRVLHTFTVLTQPVQTFPARTADDTATAPISKRWLYSLMFKAVARKVIRSPFSLHTWAALRRTILGRFLPEAVIDRYKAYQRGECNRCGLCCKIQFQCPFFIDEGPYNTSCAIYTTPHVPSACLKFPVDPLDLKLLQREIGNACTFYFEGEPQKLSILQFGRLYAEGLRQQLAKRKLKEAADTTDQ